MNPPVPPTPFEFATAGRILFGPGRLDEVAPLAGELGQRALVVTGRRPERAEPLILRLRDAGLETSTCAVPGEPTTLTVQSGLERARAARCDLVIGFGGGSAIDSAKAIAGLLTNEGDLMDHLEVIGGARPLARPGVPCIAVPTTAGTGAEVTRNSVIASPEHRVKVSLRSPFLLPRLAVVDPDLLRGLPRTVAAVTGLDALTQLIEPFTCARANPLVDGLCREAIPRAARALRRVGGGEDDPAARSDMALASLCGGLALANAGLGAVHGFAGPVGGRFPAPHGAVCAALLPHVMAANFAALERRAAESPVRARYHEVARLLTGRPDARAAEGVEWVRALCRDLAVPGLAQYGVTAADFPALVEKAARASSMKANPIRLEPAELEAILAAAL